MLKPVSFKTASPMLSALNLFKAPFLESVMHVFLYFASLITGYTNKPNKINKPPKVNNLRMVFPPLIKFIGH